MKKIVFSIFGLVLAVGVFAQETPLETARTFMRSGDFNNAILVLNSALKQDANNLDLQKDIPIKEILPKHLR
jgi:hypothetical protein